MLTPIEAAKLLNLCQIPFDIQQKILMYFLSYGTYSSPLIKFEIEDMNKYTLDFEILYTERTFTSYFIPLGLFDYMKMYFEDEDGEPCFPEFLYELEIAYNLYHFDTELDVIHLINELKDVTKNRLNKMIASEPEMN